MKILDRQDLCDILHGCAILGTGGGGELQEGLDLINAAFAAGKQFQLVSMEEAPDDALVCTPYILGAISALPPEEERAYSHLPQADEPAILLAYRRFETYLNATFYGTIACELGGSNTAVSFFAAAMNDQMIMDADVAGRAVPEITHSTYYFNDLPASPIVAANEFGECMIFENIVDDQRAETIVRAMSVVSRHEIAAIDHALPVSTVRSAVIPGTISKALLLGQRYREVKTDGADLPAAIAEAGGGIVAFAGKISSCDWKTEAGFTIGTIYMEGTGLHAGHTYRIWLKNENLVGWLDGDVHTTIPDLICLIDTDTGEPVTNPNYAVGMNVAVIILPAPAAFLTQRGLAAFGPSYVGIDAPYKPSVPAGD